MPPHIYPLIRAFNVQENAVFIHEFSKTISLPWEGGPPPTPSPARSLRSLALPPPQVQKSWLRQLLLTMFGERI